MKRILLASALLALAGPAMAEQGSRRDPPTAPSECVRQYGAYHCQIWEERKAVLKENWAGNINIIKAIELSYKCGLAEEPLAMLAIRNIQGTMFEEAARASIPELMTVRGDIIDITQRGVAAGKALADGGACTSMTPTDRGRLRALVENVNSAFWGTR